MTYDEANSLREAFGYVPREDERWVVYENALIVIHPKQKPRLYMAGCGGVYNELEPVFL